MASLRDLKRQIGSVKNIAKVTEALQTVSAVKFRKAEARVKKARPYADNVEQMMRDVARSASGDSPLLAGREVRRIVVATMTADRGLAGGFNAQVLRRTARFRAEKQGEADLGQVASGRKSVAFFRFRNIELDHVYTGYTDSPTYEQAREIGRALTQRPVVTRLLPVTPEDEGEEEQQDAGTFLEYIEDAGEILERLVPRYVETMVWQALLESAAGEHGARMTAMKNATDNANDLATDLTLEMNKARQAQITREISEIAAGAEALSAG